MTPRPAPDCAHERRPGTTVCLYCRAEERTVVRKRRQRSTLRLLALGGASAGVLALLVGGIPLLGSSDDATRAAPASRASGATEYPVAQAGAVAPAPAAAAAALAPAVPVGRTQLAGGIFAERRGDTVVVHFDTQGSRTRRSDKFETVVRETLPRVLGDAGTRALAQVAPGALIPAGELLAVLAAGPLRLPTGDGRVVSVMPGARPGQDGPLVVTYQVVVDAAAATPTS